MALSRPFPGLGLVLTPPNYAAATNLTTSPIAYVKTLQHARALQAIAASGTPFTAVIVDDERNGYGPSGPFLTPNEYAAAFTPIYEVLRGVAPVHTMGLQSVRGRFDSVYHAQLPLADGRAWNPNKTSRAEVERGLRLANHWILSPAPFRGCWDRFWHQPVTVRDWVVIAGYSRVRAVALWCLREIHDQPQHGLVDRRGRVTNVGREVQQALA